MIWAKLHAYMSRARWREKEERHPWGLLWCRSTRFYSMPQWCENKKLWLWQRWRGGTAWLLCGTGFPFSHKKTHTSTLLFRAQQPLFLISSSVSSIGLTVCSGLWTNSPFYSTSLLTALMAGTAQRRVNYCTAHGWHTAALWPHQFKKHECVTRRPAV